MSVGSKAVKIAEIHSFCVAVQPKLGSGRLSVKVSGSHTHTHTPDMTLLNECSACHRGRYLHNTQQTKETNICALSGVRTSNPSNQMATYLRLRLHGHHDRP